VQHDLGPHAPQQPRERFAVAQVEHGELARDLGRALVELAAELEEAVLVLVEQDEAARREAAARIPMRRFGRPDEVAAAVRFLASAEAGYITGSTLKIDGGIL